MLETVFLWWAMRERLLILFTVRAWIGLHSPHQPPLESSTRSLEELTKGSFGRALNATTATPVAELLTRSVAFELQGFGDDQKRFFCLFWLEAVLLLRKYKQPFGSVQVEVEGDQQPDWPHAFTQIRITFVIGWQGKFDRKLVDEALDLACNKYCPVDATLTHGTKIAVDRRDT